MQTLKKRLAAVAIALTLLLVAVVATRVFDEPNTSATVSSGNSETADSRSVETPTCAGESTMQASPKRAAHEDIRTPDAFESSIPLAELFSALKGACEASDLDEVRIILRLLLDRDEREVAAAALVRLDGMPEDGAEAPASSPPPPGLYRTQLYYLVGRVHPERLFHELRTWWSEPEIAPERLAAWTKFNKKSKSRLAKDALSPGDKWQARASASVLVDYAREGQASGMLAYALLEQLYGNGLPQGEVPDPWLSEIVEVIGKHFHAVQPDHLTGIRRMFTGMAKNEMLSARLRAQIRVLLVPECGEFADLLQFCESAEELAECAEALKRYLLRSDLSRDELRMLLQLLFQRHSLRTNEPNRFMETVAEAALDPAGKERLGTLATDLLHLTIEQPDGTYWPALVEFIEGLHRGMVMWGMPAFGPRSRPNVFGGSPDVALDLIKRCREQAARDPYLKRRRSLTESRMINWIWNLTASVDWKAQAITDLLRDRNHIHKDDFTAIIQGLASYRDEIAVQPSQQVIDLVRRILEESDFGDNMEPPLERTSWEGRMWAFSFCKVLSALRFPDLGEAATAKIVRVARAVIDAAPDWQPNIALSARQIQQMLTVTEEILAAYS